MINVIFFYSVYSSHLKWKPIGNQSTIFPNLDPLHPDIILAKLNPHHEIHLEAYAVKGELFFFVRWRSIRFLSHKQVLVE